MSATVVAIDGPAAAGKGMLARNIAKAYAFAHLDTGLLYRGVALALLQAGKAPDDLAAAAAAAKQFDIAKVDEAAARTKQVGEAASVVAAMAPVRAALFDYQRAFAGSPPGGAPGAVLDGRDIGTVICPDASVKLFVTASPEVRARRRWLELKQTNPAVSLEDIMADLARRDARDAERADAPLKPASDACLLDTSDLSIDEAFEAARRLIDRVLAAGS